MDERHDVLNLLNVNSSNDFYTVASPISVDRAVFERESNAQAALKGVKRLIPQRKQLGCDACRNEFHYFGLTKWYNSRWRRHFDLIERVIKGESKVGPAPLANIVGVQINAEEGR